MAKPGNPTLPVSKINPVGGDDLFKSAMSAVKKQLKATMEWVLKEFGGIQYATNTALVTNKRYDYLLDVDTLRRITSGFKARMSAQGMYDAMAAAVKAAYQRGVGTASASLAKMTDDYTRKITSIITTSEYQRRVSLIASRVFEEMQGFADEHGRNLGRILMQGVQDGKSPHAVAREIRDTFGVARSRAERIARTEITGALRRGRWDEARDTQEKLGIETRLMHFSALSPTTRITHAERHGEVFTVDEVADWYSEDANAINCKCTQVEVLVDADGNVVQDKLQARETERKDQYVKSAKAADDQED